MRDSYEYARGRILRCLLLSFIAICFAGIAEAARPAEDAFVKVVLPFGRKHCFRCHNSKKSRGELDLSGYASAADVVADFRKWNHVIEFIRGGEMPPEDERQPTLEERNAVVGALEEILLEEAKKHAGDPGLVLPRRLSNTEYDLSVRELTGVDIRPTKTFPPDPAGGEGFDNTGEALAMSPNLLKKYLGAAEEVSSHLVLTPDGITFAPFSVKSYAERRKLTEGAIIDFYERHDVRVFDYLEAAWRFRFRSEEDRELTVQRWAKRNGLSENYLATLDELLREAVETGGLLRDLGVAWRDLSAPNAGTNLNAIRSIERMIQSIRKQFGFREENLIRAGAGNWPIGHLDFRARVSRQRDKFDPRGFKNDALIRFDRVRKSPPESDAADKALSLFLRVVPLNENDETTGLVIVRSPLFSREGRLPRNEKERKDHGVVSLRALLEEHAPEMISELGFGLHPEGDAVAADSFVVKAPAVVEVSLNSKLRDIVDGKHLLMPCELGPSSSGVRVKRSTKLPPDASIDGSEWLVHGTSDQAKQLRASGERFCRVFPNRFFYVDRNRGLAAGFHLVDGFFRDDKPLVEKVLDAEQRAELDRLWRELDFVTASTETLLRGFVWFERSERHVLHDPRFNFLRAEDPLLIEKELLREFERVYLEKMGVQLIEGKIAPKKPHQKFDLIHGFFERIRDGLALQKELLREAEAKALLDVFALAERAYRRPLSESKLAALNGLYKTLRDRGQGVEAALRGLLIAVLMSPDFAYRYTEAPLAAGIQPLSSASLASRLSFFLWSTLPDAELMQSAGKDSLENADELVAQTRRMMKDPKIESFAREFFGQWLRYRDFLQRDSINAAAFRGYDDDLRRSMAEEPVRLLTQLIIDDRPVTDLLNSDVTFLNKRLARHYGGKLEKARASSVAKLRAAGKAIADDDWVRVEGLRAAGRGGLFGMSVLLTANSAGERTSPVKRGFWTVHHLLGQHFPPPPADVPELPKSEKTAGKTIRELLRIHAEDASCAMCHRHFDGLGLALEGFDPIGRSRVKDLAGRLIDNKATLPNGQVAEGISGLIDYVERQRRDDFVRTLCRKFLGYALGRSVVLSDRPLLNEMAAALAADGYRFSVLFEAVVTSRQFRMRRSD